MTTDHGLREQVEASERALKSEEASLDALRARLQAQGGQGRSEELLQLLKEAESGNSNLMKEWAKRKKIVSP